MDDELHVVGGTGCISMAGFGQINRRRENVAGGRQYFTVKTDNGEYATAAGESITGGPETWHYEPDIPFLLADCARLCIEVTRSFQVGGRYAVKYRYGVWPSGETGAW